MEVKTGAQKQGMNELNVKYTALAQKIIDRLYDGIPTEQIDELTAQLHRMPMPAEKGPFLGQHPAELL